VNRRRGATAGRGAVGRVDAARVAQVAAAHGRGRAVMRTFEAASATGGAGGVVGRPHLVCSRIS